MNRDDEGMRTSPLNPDSGGGGGWAEGPEHIAPDSLLAHDHLAEGDGPVNPPLGDSEPNPFAGKRGCAQLDVHRPPSSYRSAVVHPWGPVMPGALVGPVTGAARCGPGPCFANITLGGGPAYVCSSIPDLTFVSGVSGKCSCVSVPQGSRLIAPTWYQRHGAGDVGQHLGVLGHLLVMCALLVLWR